MMPSTGQIDEGTLFAAEMVVDTRAGGRDDRNTGGQ